MSITNIMNLIIQPYNKDNQYIHVLMSEIVLNFKDIVQLNPLFYSQITNISINQVASSDFDRPSKLTMPGSIKCMFEEGLIKLAYLKPVASKVNVMQNYLVFFAIPSFSSTIPHLLCMCPSVLLCRPLPSAPCQHALSSSNPSCQAAHVLNST